MKSTIVVFPGSNCNRDCYYVLNDILKQPTEYVWHRDTVPADTDLVVLPGGFSYGDYLRVGALAKFSHVGRSIVELANKGRFILGICNGFQILIEMGLLPGALIPNRNLRFVCKDVSLKVVNPDTPFTLRMKGLDTVSIPVAHGYGNYYDAPDKIKTIEDNEQVIFQYASGDGTVNAGANPNGSVKNIAGICNEEKNVMGMMPHPERASDNHLGSTDGLYLFKSIIER